MTHLETRSAPVEVLLVGVGLLGSLAVAAASYVTGATPAYFLTHVPAAVDVVGQRTAPATGLFYAGVALLAVAWLGLLRLALTGRGPLRWVVPTCWAWALPLVLCAPVGSRDVWAYLAQADVAAHGRSPYDVTPSSLPSRFVADMTPRWQDTTSPYGALWTLVTRAVVPGVDDHALLGALVFKVINGIGLVLLVFATRAVTRRLGLPSDVALLVTAASPLTLVHLVGGGHNDLLMIGLLTSGLAVALGRGSTAVRLAVAGALVGLAVAVKLPAVVVLPFLPMIRLRAEGEPLRARPVAAGLAAAVAGGAAVVLIVSVVAGYGFGWLTAGNTAEHGGGLARVGVTVVVLVAIWLVSFRVDPRVGAVVALLVVIALSPSVLAWYWAWPLAVLVLLPIGRVVAFTVATLDITVLAAIRPTGQATGIALVVLVPVAAVLCAAVLLPRTTLRRPVGARR